MVYFGIMYLSVLSYQSYYPFQDIPNLFLASSSIRSLIHISFGFIVFVFILFVLVIATTSRE